MERESERVVGRVRVVGKDLVLTAIKSWDFSAFLSLILTMRGVAVWPGGGGCRERVMEE